MRKSIRRFRAVALVAAFALTAAACGGDAEEPGAQDTEPAGDVTETEEETAAEGQRVEGGTVVFGADQEPAIMNSFLEEGNLFANGLIAEAILEGAYEVLPDFTYSPQLIDGEAEVTEDPFTVTYNIKQEATWSDGTPVTAEDFVFTFDTIMNEDYTITSRDGYDKITNAEVVDEKTVTFTYGEVFAPYRDLFDEILPKHLLEGEDFNTVWNDTLVGSGPYLMGEWTKGSQVTLTKNENYWAETKPSIDEVVIRFIEDSQTQVQQLRGGEIDMFYPQPQLDLVDTVTALDTVEWEASLGPIWEHMDMNVAKPGLDKLYVRQAMAHAIDRQAIVEQLIQPVVADAVPLHNVIWMSNQPQYEPHYEQYSYDPAMAEQLLTDNGCEQGGDGIYSCDGDKLSFGFVFTAGNEARALQFQIIQAQLREVGIEVTDESGEAATVFGEVLTSKDWDIFAFAWVGSPDPFGGNTIYTCEGDLNYNNYCNEEVTDLINATNVELDADARADLYNQADALMAEDLDKLPLYQKPTFFAWNANIVGPEDNATQAGPFWNIEEWFLTE
ncbi:MAG: ABC transporter family substrate-binding protein [Nitriliruptorales bacterium]